VRKKILSFFEKVFFRHDYSNLLHVWTWTSAIFWFFLGFLAGVKTPHFWTVKYEKKRIHMDKWSKWYENERDVGVCRCFSLGVGRKVCLQVC
jgi:hypothetical protein